MSNLSKILSFCILLFGTVSVAYGQQFINQEAVAEVLSKQSGDIGEVPDVFYEYYVLYSSRDNNVIARNTMYKIVGEGDLTLGKQRSKLIELLNRKIVHFASVGDTLIIPTEFDLDFRAYSPFPHYYVGGKDFSKLFVIDKSVQAWAAYEHGKLKRWGVVNTGAKESPTPKGRYNFNWKTEYRISTLSPPDEPWEMYWVFNFHHARGIHIHQYAFPTGGPTSHGCVRLIDDDAKFIYDWADSWKTTLGNGPGSEAGKILAQGTTVIVIGDDPVGAPRPFDYKKRFPVLKMVELPDHPYDIAPGTPQQEMFDSERAQQSP
ncbi:MAG: L,D-transpeptidase family protein [Rhodothermales bacterium]|nr:L,D-transpeptidase family protein [Rhodothermales bacterium]